MSPWLVRNLIASVHEGLVGRQTVRFSRELGKSQGYGRDERAALRDGKVRQLLIHAC